MPSLQQVDTSPIARTTRTPLEDASSSFANRFRENQVNQQDTDSLRRIYEQHQGDGDNLSNILKSIQTDTQMSPTSKVKNVDQLLKFQEHNSKMQKTAQMQMAQQQKAQKAQRESDEKEEQRASKLRAVRKLARDRGLPEDELDDYVDNIGVAERTTAPAKESKKTQASQPIEEDQLKRINHVEDMDAFKNGTINQKKKLLRDNGVSKENSDSVIDPYIEEEKIKSRALENSPAAKYEINRVSDISSYVKNGIADQEAAYEQKFAIDQAKKAITSGNVTGPGIKAAALHNPYMQLIIGKTADEALLAAANKKLLEGSKGLFGPKPTEREIFILLEDMLPAIGKSEAANLAGLDFIEKLNDLQIAKGDLINKLTENGTKYVPDIQSKVSALIEPALKALEDEKKAEHAELNAPKISVMSPAGKRGKMTQRQIDAAAEQGVIFEPIKQG